MTRLSKKNRREKRRKIKKRESFWKIFAYHWWRFSRFATCCLGVKEERESVSISRKDGRVLYETIEPVFSRYIQREREMVPIEMRRSARFFFRKKKFSPLPTFWCSLTNKTHLATSVETSNLSCSGWAEMRMILSFVGLGIFVIIDVRVCVCVCVQMKEKE